MPKVLLIRNYLPDGQHSMQRFADMLKHGLPEYGWEVDQISPPACLARKRHTTHGMAKWLGYFDKYLLARCPLVQFVKRSKPDLIHICDHSNAMYLPLFRNHPRLITCHDLFAIRSWLGEVPGERKSFFGSLQQKWIFQNLRKAPHIACVSNATEADLHRLVPETRSRSAVIFNGLARRYQPLPVQQAMALLKESGVLQTLMHGGVMLPFLLHVGNNTWYKNRKCVLAIVNALLEISPGLPHKLVMAGEPPEESLLRDAQALGERVIFLERPGDSLVEALYSLASCFVFPSRAEGFGWPPIEAQACGCPVAISDIEPLKGNCGPSAITFDPSKPIEAAHAILPLLTDSVKAEAAWQSGLLNVKRFASQHMLSSYVKQYQHILNENSSPG